MKTRITALLVAGALGVGMTVAIAQYPPPGGNLSIAPSDPSPVVNTQSSITVQLSSTDGTPASGVACTALVTAQPGSGAAVSPGNFVTDGSGSASLAFQSGDTAGSVTVSATCGQITSQTMLTVVGSSGGGAPLPPSTGQGMAALDETGGLPFGWLAIAMAALVAGGYGTYRIRSRHR